MKNKNSGWLPRMWKWLKEKFFPSLRNEKKRVEQKFGKKSKINNSDAKQFQNSKGDINYNSHNKRIKIVKIFQLWRRKRTYNKNWKYNKRKRGGNRPNESRFTLKNNEKKLLSRKFYETKKLKNSSHEKKRC